MDLCCGTVAYALSGLPTYDDFISVKLIRELLINGKRCIYNLQNLFRNLLSGFRLFWLPWLNNKTYGMGGYRYS